MLISTNLHWCRWFPDTFVKFGDNWYVDVEADGELEDNNKTEQLVDGQLDTTKLANQDNSKQQDYIKDTVEFWKVKKNIEDNNKSYQLVDGHTQLTSGLHQGHRDLFWPTNKEDTGKMEQNETKTKLKDDNGRQSG